MAFYTINYFSDCLNRPVSFNMFMPNDPNWANPDPPARPSKTLFLLHGYTSGAWNWVPEDLSRKYNFAVVTPNGENSFWLDGISTGHKFCTFVGKELPDYISKSFGLANSADDTYILGLSMGGFGALHTALAFPERFGKAGAMSAAYIMHEVADMKPGGGNEKANYEYYRECFGEPSALLASDNNPETLVDKLLAAGKKIPELYLCCGTEDFLIENNRKMHAFLSDRKVPHEYFESPGNHDMKFWGEYTEKIVEWMFGGK